MKEKWIEIDPYMLLAEVVSVFRDGFRGDEHRIDLHKRIADCLEQRPALLATQARVQELEEELRQDLEHFEIMGRKNSASNLWGFAQAVAAFTEKRLLEELKYEAENLQWIDDEAFHRGLMPLKYIDNRLAALKGKEKDGSTGT